MRLSMASITVFAVLLTSRAVCQSSRTLPGCETAPQIRETLDQRLSPELLAGTNFAERRRLYESVVSEVNAKYPHEVVPSRLLIDYARSEDPDLLAKLQESFKQSIELYGDDPLLLDLAARALWHRDTQASLRMLEKARQLAPDWPWPALELADLLSRGPLANKKKAAENLAAFFSICPVGVDADPIIPVLLNQLADTSLLARVAADLRRNLAHDTDVSHLRNYEALWNLEFRTHPVERHDALRKQVSDDLKKLNLVRPYPDPRWAALLIKGQRLTGASSKGIQEFQDQVIQQFPNSNAAFEFVEERWYESHEGPQEQGDASAWRQYDAGRESQIRQWMRDYPGESSLQSQLCDMIADNDSLPVQERINALASRVKWFEEYESPLAERAWKHKSAAETLLRYKERPELALDLLRHAKEENDVWKTRVQADDDYYPDKDAELKSTVDFDALVGGLTLRAKKLLGKTDAAPWEKAVIEVPLPTDSRKETLYWTNRARLADLEGHKVDALAFYQLAIQKRSGEPQIWHGKLRDDLSDEARALWLDLGGTDQGWKLWRKAPIARPKELSEGSWEKATKELPSFHLQDLSGKTWRLGDLAGKVLLINVWATWCGVCRAELPHLQKLYEQSKQRSDIQILTFDVDEDLGLVAPFLAEKGYTFPVLVAGDLVNGMFADTDLGVPQNWIVSSQGMWLESQMGFSEDREWEQVVALKLESARAGR
jgi:thiol-disulfide isomerase/thioredoxin